MASCMLDGYPLVCGECRDGPSAVKAAYTGVLLATKRIVWQIIYRLVIDMRHAGLKLLCKAQAALDIGCKNCCGKPKLRVIGDLERLLFPMCAYEGRDWPERFRLRQGHLVHYVGEYVRRQNKALRFAAGHLSCAG